MTRNRLVAVTGWLARAAHAPTNVTRRVLDAVAAFGGAAAPPLFEQTLGRGELKTALRIPEAMMRLRSVEAIEGHPPEQWQQLEEEALALQKKKGSREANELVLRRIGMATLAERNEPYLAEALHYHLAQVHAYASAPERMAHHMAASRTMPTDQDDLIFSDHVNISHVLRPIQSRAIACGLPPILIACMPRSASATLSFSLGRMMGIPVMRLSAGRFPGRFLVPSWLDMFLEGGAITQDDFGASYFNIGVLGGREIRHLFVLARDPRAAARSRVLYLAGEQVESGDALEAGIERECLGSFIPWLQGWIDCAKRTDLPFRIHWLTYREVCRDLPGILQKIARLLTDQHPSMAQYTRARDVAEVRVHFVTGNDDLWRTEVGESVRRRLWDACTEGMRALLDLKP
jgi:hypothetical protein